MKRKKKLLWDWILIGDRFKSWNPIPIYYLHVYYNSRYFPTYTLIRTYTFIEIWKNFPPTWLLGPTRLLISEKVSHLHCYWGPTLREHSYMMSDVFWAFLTYLPTLIRYFTVIGDVLSWGWWSMITYIEIVVLFIWHFIIG